MATPVCVVGSNGISRPPLAIVLAWVVDQFQQIYGYDVSLDSSTQDGQWVGLLASAIDDTNAMAVQAYNQFSPATSQGTGFSSIVKINGLARLIPSYSTAQMLIVGQAGSTINAGLVTDALGYVWALPASVVIPYSGQIIVTATCTTAGAVAAPKGTITAIGNAQPGWQTASNTVNATLGMPLEDDATLRRRQSVSTMNSSTAILLGVVGAVSALPGVASARGYENTDNLPDANGIPGHCLALVVDGGDAATIAATIKSKKGGCGTYGTSRIALVDAYGVSSNVSFFAAQKPVITVAININQLVAFTSDVTASIQASVAAWINARGIGNSIQWNRLYAAAYLNGAANSATFEIMSLAVARDGGTPVSVDLPIAFYEEAVCSAANVTVRVLN